MNKNKTIEIRNPLNTGFYEGSILYPGEGGNGIEYGEFEDDDYQMNGYLSRHDLYPEYDFKEYQFKVSSLVNDFFIEQVNDIIYQLLDIEDFLTHKSDELLTSPKYYNFETDKAYFKVIVKDEHYMMFLNMMFSKYYDELEAEIKGRHTSYDGFISFYSNDIDEWIDEWDELDYNNLHTIFHCLLRLEGDQEDYIYELYDICSEVYYSIDKYYEDWSTRTKYDYDGRLLKVRKED